MTRVLTYADSVADLNGTPRPSDKVAEIMALADRMQNIAVDQAVHQDDEPAEYAEVRAKLEAALREVVAPPVPEPAAECSECGKTSTADSMWALYCVQCINDNFVSQPASEPYAYDVYFPGEQRAELVRDLDEILEDLTNLEHRVTPLYDHTQPASEPVAHAMTGPMCKRVVQDAIRSAYDTGYDDSRRVSAKPGDSAPGYRGRDVEADHGGALIARLGTLLAATPQPAAKPRPQPLTEEYIKRHSILAADCPGASVVLLASTVRRLAGITTQEPTA